MVEAQKRGAEAKQKARVSTADPEARVMRMAGGGFWPAYNIQLATDTQTQIITGVEVSNSGGDYGRMVPNSPLCTRHSPARSQDYVPNSLLRNRKNTAPNRHSPAQR
jgi:hypothetical protein